MNAFGWGGLRWTSEAARYRGHGRRRGLLLLAAVIFWDASALQLGQTYGVGPKAMPYVVATGMALLAVGNLVLAWRGDFPERESLDPKPIILILGGLGRADRHHRARRRFHPGDRRPVCRDVGGIRPARHPHRPRHRLVLGVVVYLLFDKLLTLSLPAGPIERLL